MAKIKDLNHLSEVLKSKLGEAKHYLEKSYYIKDGGVGLSYYKGKIETLEYVIKNVDKLKVDKGE